MVIGALRCDVFHTSKCVYLSKIKPSSSIYFDNKDLARACGYRHCRYCSATLKYYNEDKKNIDSFMKSNGMTHYFYDDSIFIEHGIAAWKITTVANGPQLVLWHANTENYSKLEKRGYHLIHHYHLQKYKGELNIMSMLKYIVEHDEWKAKHAEDYKNMPTDTKNQKKLYKKAKNSSRRREIKNVYNLIEKLSTERKGKE